MGAFAISLRFRLQGYAPNQSIASRYYEDIRATPLITYRHPIHQYILFQGR